MAKFKGFSLIELLIVMTIIGILATMGIPVYSKQVNAAKRSDCKAMLMKVQSKIERYIFDNNTYPSSLAMMREYNTEMINSAEGYYKINIVAPSSNCPIISCYVLRGVLNEQKGGRVDEGEMLLSSNGTRSGEW
jgi:prepilin-type N-terminal cleavage/methylation domain-containing protein